MLRILSACCLCLLAAPSPLLAQMFSVSGTVLDQSGAIVPGASVTVAGPGGRFSETSGPRGGFTVPNVPPGTYDVTVALLGFSQQTHRGVVVGDADVVLPPVILTTGNRNETVIVTASRTQTALIDAPATISVVSEDVLAIRRRRTTPTCCVRCRVSTPCSSRRATST